MGGSRITSSMTSLASLSVFALFVTASSGAADPFGAGEWGDEVNICDGELMLMHGSGYNLYAYMLGRLVMSPDLGSSWVEREGFNGHIFADGDMLYRVNVSDWPEEGTTILFSESDDKGASWSTPVETIEMAGTNDGAYGIFARGDNLVAYTYDDAGSSDGTIMSACSSDGGETWSDKVYVDDDVHVEDPLPSRLAYAHSKLYMAYWNYTDWVTDSVVTVVESSDMGASWGDKRTVAIGGFEPLIVADGDELYVTYLSVEGICMTNSSDGDMWSTPQLIGPMTDLTDSSLLHSLVAVSGNLFVAYSDYVSGDETYKVVLKHSPDGGESWTDLGDVTTTDHNCIAPALHYSPGLLHVTWVDVGTGSWTDEGVTQYRSLTLITGDEPIPEFPGGAYFVVAVLAVCFAFVAASRRRRKA
jgi:hypothetical protein